MDLEKLDADFFTRTGSYTAHYYRDVYPSIDPSRPELSQRNKIVIITGASGGIGAEGLAPAFAQAGARAIILVGRRREKLGQVAASLRERFPSVEFLEAPADISDATAVQTLFETIGNKYGVADVLINNAGILNEGELVSGDPKAWWSNFEVNVHGTYLITKEFLKRLGSTNHGTVIGLTSGAATVVYPGHSGYSASKLLISKLGEFIAAEHPNVVSVSMDPGTVETDMMFGESAGFALRGRLSDDDFLDAMRKFAVDTPQLAGGMAVWLATEQAAFLTGRFVSANWSVDDLLEKKDSLAKSEDLKFKLQGKFGQ